MSINFNVSLDLLQKLANKTGIKIDANKPVDAQEIIKTAAEQADGGDEELQELLYEANKQAYETSSSIVTQLSNGFSVTNKDANPKPPLMDGILIENHPAVVDAFTFEKEDAPVNGSNLQTQFIIDKPLYYTFNIPTENRDDSILKGQGDYKTTRIDDFAATYDSSGKLVSITTYDKNDPEKVLGEHSYTYNDDGTFSELHKDFGTGVVTQSTYYEGGTLASHAEYMSQSDYEDGNAFVQRDYTYGINYDGNPFQTMTNNFGVTATTIKKPDGTYEQLDNDKIKIFGDAFNYDREDKPVNGSNLQSQFIIDKPLFYKFNIPTEVDKNKPSVFIGQGDYKTTRIDNFAVTYDFDGKLQDIVKYDKNDPEKIIGKNSYQYYDDGTFSEFEQDFVTGTRIETLFNPNGTIRTHSEYMSEDAYLDKDAFVTRNYSYDIDKDGNPVQTMVNNRGITVTTTKNADGTYTQVNSYVEEQKAKQQAIADAFNFERDDKPVNGTNLRSQQIINQPLYYTFDIPAEQEPGTATSGIGSYGTGREDYYDAEFGSNGKIETLKTYKEEGGKQIGENTYTYNDDGTFVELHKDFVTDVVIETKYNADGTVNTHSEYMSQDSYEDGEPWLSRNYSYGIDKDGNPVQTMVNSRGITVTTTKNADGTYSQVNSYIEEQKKKAEEASKISTASAPGNTTQELSLEGGIKVSITDGYKTTVFDADGNKIEDAIVSINSKTGDVTLSTSDNKISYFDKDGKLTSTFIPGESPQTSSVDGNVIANSEQRMQDGTSILQEGDKITVFDKEGNELKDATVLRDAETGNVTVFTENLSITYDSKGNSIEIASSTSEVRPETEKPEPIIGDGPGVDYRIDIEIPASKIDGKNAVELAEIKAAFDFEKEDIPVNGSNLQSQFVIDKPLYYTFNIPTENRADSVLEGQGDYKTTRIDNFDATYDSNGKLVSITTYDLNDPNKVIGENIYTYNDDGTFSELEKDFGTGVVIETGYNANGTIDTHNEYATQKDYEDGKPEVARNYSYGINKDGNPFQTMVNNLGITVITTKNADGTYTQFNSYVEEQNRKAEAEAGAKAAEEAARNADAAKQSRNEELGKTDIAAKEAQIKATLDAAVQGTPEVPENVLTDLSGLSDSEKIKAAFAYDGADAAVNGRQLTSNYTIRVPEKDKNDVADTGAPNSKVHNDSQKFTAEYDSDGNLSSIVYDNGSTRFDYSKDKDGNLVETEINYIGSNEITYVYTYNPDNTLKSHVDYWSEDAKENNRPSLVVDYSYEVDSNGNPVQIRTSEYGVYGLTRQPDGTLTSEKIADSPEEAAKLAEEAAKKAEEATTAAVEVARKETIKIEAADKTEAAENVIADLSNLSDSEKIKAAFSYDGADAKVNGRKLESGYTIRVPEKDRNGVAATGTPNSKVHNDSLKFTAEYDSEGNLSSIVYDHGRTRFDYWNDEDGNLVESEINYVGSNEITYLYTYNPDNTLKSHVDFWDESAKEKNRPSMVVDYSYTVDANGNPVQIRTSERGVYALTRQPDGTLTSEKIADSPEELEQPETTVKPDKTDVTETTKEPEKIDVTETTSKPELSVTIDGQEFTVDINDGIVDKTQVTVDGDKVILGPKDETQPVSSDTTAIDESEALKDLFERVMSMLLPGMGSLGASAVSQTQSYADTITVSVDGVDIKLNSEVANNAVINYNKNTGKISVATGEIPAEKVEDKTVTAFTSDKRIKTDNNGNKYINVEKWSSEKGNNGALYSIIRNSYDLDAMGIKFGDKKFEILANAIMDANPEIYGSADGKIQGRTRILDGTRPNSVIHENDKIILPDAYDIEGLGLQRPKVDNNDDSTVQIKVSAGQSENNQEQQNLLAGLMTPTVLPFIAMYIEQFPGITASGINMPGGIQFPVFTVNTEETEKSEETGIEEDNQTDAKDIKDDKKAAKDKNTELREAFDEQFVKFMQEYNSATTSQKNDIARKINSYMKETISQMTPDQAQALSIEYNDKLPQVQESRFGKAASSLFSSLTKGISQLANLKDSDEDDDGELKSEDEDSHN